MLHRPALRMALVGFLLGASAVPACAKDIVVHMKNKGADGAMVFEPAFVKAAPGDVIHFRPTDPSHNAETISTMLPAGATPMKGLMNKEAVMTVSKPGLYGIKCMPHYSMGMVALVQVGKPTPTDIAAAKAVKLPPFAMKRMTGMLNGVK
ncbi:pseudoazurin [Sphingobium sp. H39-3-25]|uniref:pseudoazurin n=1 Tax=Sphingobium arseniciresistens TaxID=3030834 RepID=UPI0023B95086|nr:pseudoazurin [Sphingobium arseniciresistens]